MTNEPEDLITADLDWRKQHQDIATPSRERANYTVLSHADQLIDGGWLDKAGWQAAQHYRRDIEVGEFGGRITDASGVRGGGGGCPTQSRLDALQRLRQARQAVGKDATYLLDAMIYHTLPWDKIARRLTCRRDTAKKRCAEALTALAEHYELYGSGTRTRSGSSQTTEQP